MQSNLEILEWYVESGVDLAMDERPVNRFEEVPQSTAVKTLLEKSNKKSASPVPTSASTKTEATVPDGKVVATAREIALSAKTLEELKTGMKTPGSTYTSPV